MKIKFTISSNINFYKTTYPIIVESLLKSGISKDDIYFFIGGYDVYEKIENEYDVNVYRVDHNSIDMTGLISIMELGLISDFWFLLHDTCYVGNNFFENIKNRIIDTNAIPLYSPFSMNMGLYRMNYLNDISSDIIKFKNKNYDDKSIDSVKRNAVITEDIFLKDYMSHVLNISKVITSEPIDFYKNGVDRVIERYNDIDLFKVKANWFGKEKYEIKL